ncbi:ABC transporter permease [Tumebacillus flagellatus]|uniref:ABC transporter permease n=1 Tax=Tumebacillus flagellatus TaxID=1157490 RepID=A0A074LM80_9BACL|nr:ABC-2 family transporter protein [Tumebacillus flagellatus]KEO80998.1 ABC transporter permease [Tumebacillus flagellatus]
MDVSREKTLREPRVSSLALQVAKYTAVGKITVRNNLAYLYDYLIRSLFLLVILYIFAQLWRVTYDGIGTATISGYTFEQLLWYLVFAEAMVLSSPRLARRIEDEVKKGDVAYQLTRPVSYLLFQYAQYMGEAYVLVPVHLLVGGALGTMMFGVPHFGWGWIGFLLISVGAFTVNFLLNMILALTSFWIEETRGLEFVYYKIVFTLGGMLLPLEMFGGTVRQIADWLPFQCVVYFPSKTAVQFDAGEIGHMLGVQAVWAAVLTVCLTLIYRKGVKKLNVNGG